MSPQSDNQRGSNRRERIKKTNNPLGRHQHRGKDRGEEGTHEKEQRGEDTTGKKNEEGVENVLSCHQDARKGLPKVEEGGGKKAAAPCDVAVEREMRNSKLLHHWTLTEKNSKKKSGEKKRGIKSPLRSGSGPTATDKGSRSGGPESTPIEELNFTKKPKGEKDWKEGRPANPAQSSQKS